MLSSITYFALLTVLIGDFDLFMVAFPAIGVINFLVLVSNYFEVLASSKSIETSFLVILF